MKFSQLAMAAIVVASVEAVNLGAHNKAMSEHDQMALAQANAGTMQHHSTGLSQADEDWGWDDITSVFNKAKKWVSKKWKKAKKDIGGIVNKVKKGDWEGAVNGVKDEINEAGNDVAEIGDAVNKEKDTFSK